MHMDGWEDFLHFSFLGEHILLQTLPLNSFANFFWGALLTVLLCLAERSLTFAIAKHWSPFPSTRHSRMRNAIWRAAIYWLATVLRLAYMLVAMSYNVGLIIVTATALAAGQFVIEYLDAAEPSSRESYLVNEPLLGGQDTREGHPYPPQHNRHRSKTKPEGIFIHPNESNVFRADAVALEMGITGDTERLKGNGYVENEEAREHGKRGDKAREILASSSRLKFSA